MRDYRVQFSTSGIRAILKAMRGRARGRKTDKNTSYTSRCEFSAKTTRRHATKPAVSQQEDLDDHARILQIGGGLSVAAINLNSRYASDNGADRGAR